MAGTPFPFADTTMPKLDPWDKNVWGKLIKIMDDWAAGGMMIRNFTVALVAPGIMSLLEMMNVGAPKSWFAGGITDAKFSVTVTGGDIEVERVKFTSGPNFPGPNVALKTMAKLLTTAVVWTENTIEFKPTGGNC